jgi:hypothetical protein
MLRVRQAICFVTCCVDFTSNCQDTSGQLRQPLRGHSSVLREMFPGNCSDTARQLPGKHPNASPDATRVVARTLRGVRPYFLIRGWCHPKIKAFKFQKAARNHVRLNVSNWMMMGALTGRSETGSETEQVGSGMNGRRRSCARF